MGNKPTPAKTTESDNTEDQNQEPALSLLFLGTGDGGKGTIYRHVGFFLTLLEGKERRYGLLVTGVGSLWFGVKLIYFLLVQLSRLYGQGHSSESRDVFYIRRNVVDLCCSHPSSVWNTLSSLLTHSLHELTPHSVASLGVASR